jgi:hypothetical protein
LLLGSQFHLPRVYATVDNTAPTLGYNLGGFSISQRILGDLKQRELDRERAIRTYRLALKQRAAIKKTAQARPVGIVAPVYHPPVVVTSGCGDNSYAHFIYMHESGCSTTSVNAGGCRGIGQACPGSKLPCGADYACQNAYFTRYALSTYGSWANAYNFWLGHNWW